MENKDKFPPTENRILAKEKCKVGELLDLCKEDPDSVIDRFRTNIGNEKCLPDIEIDPEELRNFEETSKSVECIPKLKSIRIVKNNNILNQPLYLQIIKSKNIVEEPLNSQDTKREDCKCGDTLMAKKSLDEQKTPLKGIIKTPLQGDQVTKGISANGETKPKETVTIMESVEISSLLPKVSSPLQVTKVNNRHRKRIRKRHHVRHEQKISQETTYNADSEAVAILKKVIKEHKKKNASDDNKLAEAEQNKTENKISNPQKSKKWTDVFCFLNKRKDYCKL